MLSRRDFLTAAGVGGAATKAGATPRPPIDPLDLNYTDPVDPTIREGCNKPTIVDGSGYSVPDPLIGAELAVVDTQSAYPSPLTFAALPRSSSTEWRLVNPLRAAAATPGTNFTDPLPIDPPPGWDLRTPLDSLKLAAQDLASSGGQLHLQHRIRALSDLAVTGRLAYETLSKMGFTTPQDVVTAMALGPSLDAAALQVVQRAQSVAWAIRGNPSWRAALRPHLGWIGVSGEDDAPHRPCNVFSLPVPQYDIKLSVWGLTFTTRIAIAEAPWQPPVPSVGVPPTFLPTDEVPTISPDSDVVFLYMSGDASRAEEAADLIPALLSTAAAHGRKASVIAFDMIGWGYSARRVFDASGTAKLFDQKLIPTAPYPGESPALLFVEYFVESLLNALHAGPPFIDLNRVVPIGGSLGGNLALRLGRRSDLPWLKAVCAWSAASVWPSKKTNPDVGTSARIGTEFGCGIGFLVGLLFGGVGVVASTAVGCGAGAGVGAAVGPPGDQWVISDLTEKMTTPEDSNQRQKHFAEVFDDDTLDLLFVTLVPPQARMWYRDDWQPCKDISMCQDRLDRREVYDQTFRRWHERMSMEQIVYSHRDPDTTTGKPRYLLNTIPMLLAAGEKDDYTFANIYSYTRDLASKMTVAGTTLFLKDTGHSIHNERPLQLAQAIFDFLDAYWKPTIGRRHKDLSYLFPLLLAP